LPLLKHLLLLADAIEPQIFTRRLRKPQLPSAGVVKIGTFIFSHNFEAGAASLRV